MTILGDKKTYLKVREKLEKESERQTKEKKARLDKAFSFGKKEKKLKLKGGIKWY